MFPFDDVIMVYLTDFPDLEVDVEGVGKMKVDISYGGMFFAICDVKKLGLDIHSCGVDALAQASDRIVGKRFYYVTE